MTLAASPAAMRFAAAPLLGVLSAVSLAADDNPRADIPYVPTPPAVVDAMLKLANVGPRDFVIDLGSGDGRILIAAAKQRGARGYGVEINGGLVAGARREAERQGVADRVEFREENLFITEIGRATALTLYLSPSLMLQLRPRMLAELKPGVHVVSHDFDMGAWRPDARVTVPVPGKPYGPPSSEVYLWVVPANAAGTWKWTAAAAECEVALSQVFQELDGRPVVGAGSARLEAGRMRGDRIRFILAAGPGGGTRQEYSGRVSGDTISGTVRTAAGDTEWKATRVKRGAIETK